MLSLRTILISLCLVLPASASAQAAETGYRTGNDAETGLRDSAGTAGDIWFDIIRVVDGDTFWVGDETLTVSSDRLVESPKDIVHCLSNNSGTIARIMVVKAPWPVTSTRVL